MASLENDGLVFLHQHTNQHRNVDVTPDGDVWLIRDWNPVLSMNSLISHVFKLPGIGIAMFK